MSFMNEKFLLEQMARNVDDVLSAAVRDRGVDFASGVASGFEMRQIGVAIDGIAARAAAGDDDGVAELKEAIGDLLSSLCSRTVGDISEEELKEALGASDGLFAAWELSNKAVNILNEKLGEANAQGETNAATEQPAQPDAKPTVIKPTVGRRVWYWPSDYDRGLADRPPSVIVADGKQPCDAGIVYVWGDRMVNLTVADHNGAMHKRTSVKLLQEGDLIPLWGGYATWMPYQTAQAAKAEQPAEPTGIAVFLTEDPDHGDAPDSYGGTTG